MLFSSRYHSIVSLGNDCATNFHLRRKKLTTESMPFDNLITPFNSLLICLKTDFAYFLDRPAIANGGLLFYHDFVLNDLPEVRAKYARRIERFRALRDKHTLFVRRCVDVTIDGLEDLRLALHQYQCTSFDIRLILPAKLNPGCSKSYRFGPDLIWFNDNIAVNNPPGLEWCGDYGLWDDVLANVELLGP